MLIPEYHEEEEYETLPPEDDIDYYPESYNYALRPNQDRPKRTTFAYDIAEDISHHSSQITFGQLLRDPCQR